MKKIQFFDQKNIVSENVRLFRLKNQMTQQDLASKMLTLGVSMDQQMISRIESNDRIVTGYELACLCYVLKAKPADLFGEFYQKYME